MDITDQFTLDGLEKSEISQGIWFKYILESSQMKNLKHELSARTGFRPNPARKLSEDAQEALITIFCIFQQTSGSMLSEVHNLMLFGQHDFFSYGDYAALEAVNNIDLGVVSNKLDEACKWLANFDVEAVDCWVTYMNYLSQKQGKGWRMDKTWFDAKIFAKIVLSSRNIIVEELNRIQDELCSNGCEELSKAIVHKLAALSRFTEVTDKVGMGGDDMILEAYLEPLYLGAYKSESSRSSPSGLEVENFEKVSPGRRSGFDIDRPQGLYFDKVSEPIKPSGGYGIIPAIARFFTSNAGHMHHAVPNL